MTGGSCHPRPEIQIEDTGDVRILLAGGLPPLILFVVATVSFAVRMTDAVRHALRTEMPTS